MAEEKTNNQNNQGAIGGESGGDDDSSKEEGDEDEGGGISNFWTQLLSSPVNFFMFAVALVVDVLEGILDILMLAGVFSGGIASVIVVVVTLLFDLVAFLLIGSWMFLRAGTVRGVSQKGLKKAGKMAQESKKFARYLTKLEQGLTKYRFFMPFLGLIPGVNFLPNWMAAVFLELRAGAAAEKQEEGE